MTPEVIATHEKIAAEKETLFARFRKEFAHEPNNAKLDRVLDGMVGSEVHPLAGPDTIHITVVKRKRGRPKGSKNKAKPALVRPSMIGHIPANDLVINPAAISRRH